MARTTDTAVSSFSMGDEEKARVAGGDGYVTKPISNNWSISSASPSGKPEGPSASSRSGGGSAALGCKLVWTSRYNVNFINFAYGSKSATANWSASGVMLPLFDRATEAMCQNCHWQRRPLVNRERSTFALHRIIRQPLEFKCKRVRQSHLTLRHHQFQRHSPLAKSTTAGPKNDCWRWHDPSLSLLLRAPA